MERCGSIAAGPICVVAGSWRHGSYSLMEVCMQYTLLPEGSCAALGPDRSISSLDFSVLEQKTCHHGHNRLCLDVSTSFRLSTAQQGSTIACPRWALVATIGYSCSRGQAICHFDSHSSMRALSESYRDPCGPIPARPLCKMTQWGSHRMGGNRANRLTPLILLLLCIREHRWLALHSRVVALPVHPHLLPEIVLARVHLASAGQEVALARPDPSPSVHHCMVIQLSLLFPLPG